MRRLHELLGARGGHAPVLVLVVLAAAVLRLHQLGLDSLWLDEAHTFHRARLPLGELFEESVRKRHVPSYFVLMHGWVEYAGDDEWWLRAPSALFGVLTVAVMYVAGALLGGILPGLLAAGLTAVSPAHIVYAQEARMYTLVTFAVAVALVGLVWLLRDPARAARPIWRGTDRLATAAWLAVAIGTACALLLHNTCTLFAGALGGAGLVWLAINPGLRRPLLLNGALAVGLVLLLTSWWWPFLARQSSSLGDDHWGSTDAKWLWYVTNTLAFMAQPRMVATLVLAAFSVSAVATQRQRPQLLVTLAVLTLFGPALMLGVSALATPVLMPRTALWTTLPLHLWLALGVAWLRPRTASVLAVVLALGALAWNAAPAAYPHDKPPNREIAKLLRDTQARSGAAIVLGGLASHGVSYYFERRDFPVGPVEYVAVGRRLNKATKRTLKTALAGKQRVLLLDRTNLAGENAAAIREWLGARGTATRRAFAGHLELYDYRLESR